MFEKEVKNERTEVNLYRRKMGEEERKWDRKK